MRSQFLVATLLAVISFIPASAQTASQRYQTLDKSRKCSQALPAGAVGLPVCIHGPAVGQPGDGVSRGQFSSRSNYSQPSGASVGLPQCRTSKFMGEPGDGIRSDMGHQISGQTTASHSYSRTGQASVGLPKVRTSKFMGQPGDGIRSDLGHRISGQSFQPVDQGAQSAGAQATPQPRAYTYKDYTH